MKVNIEIKRPPIVTHEGAPAARPPHAAADLRRAVMACLLWEDSFYESGVTIVERIKSLVPLVPTEVAAHFAIKARDDMKLRHVPLLLVACMAAPGGPHRRLVASTLDHVIQRADELTEFVAIYAKVWGYHPHSIKRHLSAQVKKGLAKAFARFDDYALAKYDREAAVRLRDVLFLAHSKPADAPDRRWTRKERKAGGEIALTDGERRYLRVVKQELATPDTWEVALSGGADKRETFTRLLDEGKLGALALLRNLRNMAESGVSEELVKRALGKMDARRVLPIRFVAAARAAPQFEPELEAAMFRCTLALPKLPGRTIILVDVSGSMDSPLSRGRGKGGVEMTRMDAACGLALIANELCEKSFVLTFSTQTVAVPPRSGFALRDAIVNSQQHGGTHLGRAIESVRQQCQYDRIIVITDEQSADAVGSPGVPLGYIINVAAYEHGVGYGTWNKIDGFSESVLRYITEFEKEEQ